MQLDDYPLLNCVPSPKRIKGKLCNKYKSLLSNNNIYNGWFD